MAFIHSRNHTLYAFRVAKRVLHYAAMFRVLKYQESVYCRAKAHRQGAAEIKELIGKPL